MATIIIQENDDAVLDVLTLALNSEGHQTISMLGPCPLAMANAVKRNYPDLIFVEYRSTNENSRVLLTTVKKLSPRLPVVALSSDLNISKTALKLGFSGFLSKPFDLDELFCLTKSLIRSENQ